MQAAPSPVENAPTQGPPALRRVDRREAAEALLDPGTARLLLPFWGAPCPVGRAARELGVKPNSLLKQTARLTDAGLLEVAHAELRRGRWVRHLRTTADAFFVPYVATGAENLEEGMAHKERFFETLFRRNLVLALGADLSGWGLVIARGEHGLTMRPTPYVAEPQRPYDPLHAAHPATYSLWLDHVYLDFPDAKALQRELHDLAAREAARGGGQRHLLRLGLVPVLDGD